MNIVKKNEKKFPFLQEIVDCNHDYLYKFNSVEDFDSYIILMNLYLFTCKYMYKYNITLTKESIYDNMKKLFDNAVIRSNLISTLYENLLSYRIEDKLLTQ